MSAETLAELDKIFSADAPKTRMTLDGPQPLPNIAENLKLATQEQPRHNRRTTKEENMAKKTTTEEEGAATAASATATATPVARRGKKEGKFQFLKQLIGEGTHTKSEIIALATAKFPKWDAHLLECGVYSSRTQMRKAGISGNWLPEPATA